MIDFILVVMAVVGTLFAVATLWVYCEQRREFEASARNMARQTIHETINAAGPDLHPTERVAVMRGLIASVNMKADYALRVGNRSACVLLNRVSEIIYEETFK